MRALFLLASLLLAPRAFAAVDVFACFVDVTGPCTIGDNAFTAQNGWFPVSSLAFGAARVHATGGATGEPVLRPIEIVAGVQPATTRLFERALLGQAPSEVRLAWAKSGGPVQRPYMVAEAPTPVLRTNQVQSVGLEHPVWRLSLAVSSLKLTYWKQNTNGAYVGSPLVSTWSVTP